MTEPKILQTHSLRELFDAHGRGAGDSPPPTATHDSKVAQRAMLPSLSTDSIWNPNIKLIHGRPEEQRDPQ